MTASGIFDRREFLKAARGLFALWLPAAHPVAASFFQSLRIATVADEIVPNAIDNFFTSAPANPAQLNDGSRSLIYYVSGTLSRLGVSLGDVFYQDALYARQKDLKTGPIAHLLGMEKEKALIIFHDRENLALAATQQKLTRIDGAIGGILGTIGISRDDWDSWMEAICGVERHPLVVGQDVWRYAVNSLGEFYRDCIAEDMYESFDPEHTCWDVDPVTQERLWQTAKGIVEEINRRFNLAIPQIPTVESYFSIETETASGQLVENPPGTDSAQPEQQRSEAASREIKSTLHSRLKPLFFDNTRLELESPSEIRKLPGFGHLGSCIVCLNQC